MAEKTPTIGDNSVATEAINKFFSRIDNLEEEKQTIADDIKEVWAEMKSQGHDVKALRKVYALRKLEAEQRTMIGVYADKLGIFG